MNKQVVSIIDYGLGNLKSIKRKLDRLSVNCLITSSESQIKKSDKIILPGVGHFLTGMNNLKKLHLDDILNELVQVKKIPILGICLGMQLMTEKSEEGNCNGLGWIKGSIIKFRVSDIKKYKIPHIGWNSIEKHQQHPLTVNINQNELFYFVHSYHAHAIPDEDILTKTIYDYSFVSSFSKENIMGTQFHPEKSHDQGDIVIQNFVKL